MWSCASIFQVNAPLFLLQLGLVHPWSFSLRKEYPAATSLLFEQLVLEERRPICHDPVLLASVDGLPVD